MCKQENTHSNTMKQMPHVELHTANIAASSDIKQQCCFIPTGPLCEHSGTILSLTQPLCHTQTRRQGHTNTHTNIDIRLRNLRKSFLFFKKKKKIKAGLWLWECLNWSNDKRGKGKGMYGPHPAAAFSPPQTTDIGDLKGFLKDAKMPKRVFSSWKKSPVPKKK